MKLLDLIDYVPNERNFKVIVDNPNHGMVIMMAFDKGVKLPEHSTNSNVMVQVLEGCCEFTLKGEVNKLCQGDFIVLAPQDRHAIEATERCKVLVTKIDA